jgi:hypothetical protein
MSYNTNYKIDFGQATGGQDWMIVNDGVMGGLSKSTAIFTENSLLFNGTLSLKNNGGFASIRSGKGKFDLSKYSTVKIRFRSTGRDFALRFANSEMYFRPNFKHNFSSSTGEWEIVELKMSNFKEYTMGQISGSAVSEKKLENIIRIGIILSDKKEGPFELEIDYIVFN